jgi:hypothetical protein
MLKAAFIISFSLSFLFARSQQGFFVLKKKDKTLQRFSTGSFIVFQLNTGEWISGHITKLSPDSLYIRQQAIRYSMFSIDTVHFSGLKVAVREIVAMPRKTALFYYRNDKPQLIRGHEKFAYIKNGLIFKLAGGGYAAFNITNNLIDNKPPFGKANRVGLGIATLVFLVGEALHRTYHQHLRLGKKYHLQYISL